MSDETPNEGLLNALKQNWPSEDGGQPTTEVKDAPATPPEEAKPEEEKPQDIQPTDDAKPEDAKAGDESSVRWPRRAAEWRQLKDTHAKEVETLKSQLATATAELEKAKSLPAGDIESLKKERDDFSRRLEELNLERHPKFVEYFGQRIESAIANVKELAGDKGDLIAQIAQTPASKIRDKQIADAIEEMTPFEQARIGAAISQLDAISREKAAELAKAGSHLSAIQLKEKEAAELKERTRVGAFDEVLKNWADPENPTPLQQIDGDSAWNARAAELNRTAKGYYEALKSDDFSTQANIAIQSALYPTALEALQELGSEYEKLQKELASLQSAQPDAAKSGASSDRGDTPKYDNPAKALEAELSARLKEAMPSRW